MKKILTLIILIAAGLYGYNKSYSNNPSEIPNPVYLESRVIMEVPELARDFEYVLVAEMVSAEDCEMRSEKFLAKLFKECKTCRVKRTECNANLEKRYKRLFSNFSTYTVYLSLERGSRFERNGRMVIWGLRDDEAKFSCEAAKKRIKDNYTGRVKCIGARSS